MILIAARIDVPPEARAQLLKDAVPFIEAALAEPGCREYAWTVDLQKPGRIHVIEEWDDEKSLQGHFDGEPYRDMRDHIGSRGLNASWSQKYLIAKAESVYDDDGVPRAGFAG
jgi:quinol monooxygenase YgiN